MRRVLFDLTATQPSVDSKRHGGGKYGEIVLKRIVERGLDVECFFDSNRWLNSDIKSLLEARDIKLHDIRKVELSKIIAESKVDILYSALPSNTIIKRSDINIIGTIHGLRRLETPADNYCFKYRNLNWKDWMFYFFKNLAPSVIRKMLCSYYLKAWKNPRFQMITVSNHTSNAIKVFFPDLHKKNILVFYSPSTSEYKITERKHSEKYFMMVSGNRLEKNNLRAIIALDRLFSKSYLKDFYVKITGAKDTTNFRYKIQNPNRFQFMGYVGDMDLEQLYHDAYCLVYPSVNEGFGYPPLEAMHYGVPVISSSFCSIPEICGEASIYFNPFSIDEIENRILQISDENVHKNQIAKAINRYELITAKQHADLDNLINYIYELHE